LEENLFQHLNTSVYAVLFAIVMWNWSSPYWSFMHWLIG